MKLRHIPVTLALLATIFWISPRQLSSAQTRTDGHSAQDAVCIRIPEAFAHFAEGQRLMHSDVPELSHVALKLIVTPNGTVSSATPVSGSTHSYEKATAVAMTWRFVPFQRDGTAISGTFDYSVTVVPPEQRPAGHRAFPNIKDWGSLRITLQRTGCRGHCPWYTLTVFGDGSIVYNGYDYVEYCGEYQGHVSSEVVHQLVDLFDSADYFNLFDRYGQAFDGAAYITSITFDDQSNAVVDEIGLHAGMPEIVVTVENGIDRLAGPTVWASQIETHAECWAGAKTSDLPSRIE